MTNHRHHASSTSRPPHVDIYFNEGGGHDWWTIAYTKKVKHHGGEVYLHWNLPEPLSQNHNTLVEQDRPFHVTKPSWSREVTWFAAPREIRAFAQKFSRDVRQRTA